MIHHQDNEATARKGKFAVLVGGIGSGKSTLMESLSREMPAEAIPADELFRVNPFFDLTVQDRKRWSLTSDLWFLQERAKMMRDVGPKLEQGHVVMDSGILMSYVYAHSRLNDGYYMPQEMAFYDQMFEEYTHDLLQPDVVVYLATSLEEVRRRILQRGREFEIRNYTDEYLSNIENSIQHLIRKLEAMGQVTVIKRMSDLDLLEPAGIQALIEEIQHV